MKKIIVIISVLFTVIFPVVSKAQYIAHYTESDHIKYDTLVDKVSGTKFIVDKLRVYISAIDKNGKQLWKTDPATNDKLEEYRVNRPTIVYFAFTIRKDIQKQVISIAYNNSQFGYLDENTGKFTFEGQD